MFRKRRTLWKAVSAESCFQIPTFLCPPWSCAEYPTVCAWKESFTFLTVSQTRIRLSSGVLLAECWVSKKCRIICWYVTTMTARKKHAANP